MMQVFKIIIAIGIAGVLSWGIFGLYSQNLELSEEVRVLDEEFRSLQEENQLVRERIEYFNITENLIKELKGQFNYTEEGERLMIIIPRD
ncbi:MAG: hypothetical protein WD095_00355 [Candidatus Paceibacterota bacterium]